MMLTEHFSLEELVASETAARMRIDNAPSPTIVDHLKVTCLGLEEVRDLLGGKPVHVNSGYRCAKLNAAIGGAKNSAHMSGYAADIICPEFGQPQQIASVLAARLRRYDQLILEGTWMHVSFDPQARRQNLRAHFGSGVVSYSVATF